MSLEPYVNKRGNKQASKQTSKQASKKKTKTKKQQQQQNPNKQANSIQKNTSNRERLSTLQHCPKKQTPNKQTNRIQKNTSNRERLSSLQHCPPPPPPKKKTQTNKQPVYKRIQATENGCPPYSTAQTNKKKKKKINPNKQTNSIQKNTSNRERLSSLQHCPQKTNP